MTRDLFTPATRRTDPDTSHKAARSLEGTAASIRSVVEKLAREAGPAGLIDDDLVLAFPDAPESSFRKRRSELHQEGVLVDSGRRRRNRHGNEEIIWVHRDFAGDIEARPRRQPPAPTPAPRDNAELYVRGKAWAKKLDEFAAQMKAEGRGLFANDLNTAADTMRELTK